MTDVWIAVLENENGDWLDDPKGCDTKQEVIEWALAEWPKYKLEPNDVVVVYRCVIDEVIEMGPSAEQKDG
jgi:hypothetical protein